MSLSVNVGDVRLSSTWRTPTVWSRSMSGTAAIERGT